MSFNPLFSFAVGAVLLLSGCTTSPLTKLEAQLAELPNAHTSSSPVQLNAERILSNAQTPEAIAPHSGQAKLFNDYERQLTQVRNPSVANESAMRSLSYFVGQSSLAECNQVCGLRIDPRQGVPGQFMTFTCGELTLNLRDYYANDGKQGFTLSRDKVNLLIDGQPAWLQRHQDIVGKGSTFLAWQGADRGFALFAADASDATVAQLVALAKSINQVRP